LHIHHQDEGCYPIIPLTIQGSRNDLNKPFAKLDGPIALNELALCWKSSTLEHDECSVGYRTYNARVMAKLFLKLITYDFFFTIISDPMLLWMICNKNHWKILLS
jgi:hypothetical protein